LLRNNSNNNRRSKLPFCRWLWVAGLALFVATLIGYWPGTAYAANVDAKSCAECHEDLVAAFKNIPHAVIDKKGLGKTFSCESCHGDLSKHMENPEAGNIFAFKGGDSAIDISKRCLSCHKDNHGEYFSSAHSKANIHCITCHGIHGKTKQTLLKGGPTKICYSCHEDVFAKFKLNEKHRLYEGTLGCGSCHDPHKPATRQRLAGFKQETCYKCHADKQGPFLYEHDSVRVEGCSTCHDVHGSPNRHLLVNQSVSELCYSCHTVVPGWHSRFTHTSNCANCHSTIHGSNLSSKFLK